ncbi:MAG: hypothetical protein KL863_02140 [Rhizobium sp.]|nr:hypothetical protein [Rhizobium sp.]
MKTLASMALAALLFAAPLDARATGDLGCEIADQNLKFDFTTLINRGTGLFLGGDARFETARPEVAEPLRKLDHSRLQLVHSWYEGNEIRLLFYAEHQDDKIDFASIRLTIITSTNANDDFVGSYTFTIDGAQQVVLKGKTSCLVG